MSSEGAPPVVLYVRHASAIPESLAALSAKYFKVMPATYWGPSRLQVPREPVCLLCLYTARFAAGEVLAAAAVNNNMIAPVACLVHSSVAAARHIMKNL
jgi:hypothetical protein